MPLVDGHEVVRSTDDSDIDTDEEKEKQKEREKLKAKEEIDTHGAQEVDDSAHPDAQLKEADCVDFVLEGDGWTELMPEAVKMRTVTEGSGNEDSYPAVKQYIIVSYEVWPMTAYPEFSSPPLRSYRNVLHKLGEGEAIPALELTWRHTKPGGVSEVACVARFAWGPQGSKGIPKQDEDIPADCHLFIRTTLNEVLPLDDGPRPDGGVAVWTEAVRLMSLRKISGNDHFKRGVHDKAIKCYEQGMADFLKEAFDLRAEVQADQKKIGEDMLVDCASNLAACHIELKDGEKAMMALTLPVECGIASATNNLKLHYRAAKAQLLLSNFKECEQCLNDACRLAPNDADCVRLQGQLQRAKAKHARERKKMGSKLVNNVDWSDTKLEPSWPVKFATGIGKATFPYFRGAFLGVGVVLVAGAVGVVLNYLG